MMKRWVALAVILFPAILAIVAPAVAANPPSAVVGRVYHIESDLLRFVPAESDWVAVVKDAPFGTGDTLFSGNQGMSELIVPNGSWIRIGNNTQIQFISLETELSEIDVASGVVRVYNKGSQTVIKATSPFGYVIAYPGSAFDFYVGENSIELIAVKGTVSFVHSSTQAKYDASAGSPSILADQSQVSSGEGAVDPTWDQWNRAREDFWAAKSRIRGRSAEYLPPPIRDDAYVLEENGAWETVVYEGRERRFWRPRVAPGWAPFTSGRWTDWYGDQTWIPAEPFGYVTHHYGNWVLVSGAWFWAPPVVAVRTGAPFLDVGYGWSPGRVSWIHSGGYVGWVPLAWNERYYSHHHWGGPRDVVVTNVNQVNVTVNNYAYARQAVIVNQNNFYNVNNYRNVQVTNIQQTTIINNFRAAPVVNNTVINNYNTNKQRYNFTNVVVKEKPHNTVVQRIQQNDKIISQGRREDPKVIEQQVKKLPPGKINQQAKIDLPKTTNYIVPANQVNKPKSEIKLPPRDVKGPPSGTPGKPGQVGQIGTPGKPGQVGQPATPGKPGQPTPPGQVATPGKPGQVGTPGKPGQPTPPGQVTSPRPGQPTPPGQTGQPGQIGTPGKPGQPTPPGQTGQVGQITSPRPGQPTPPGQVGQPGQVTSPRPGQPTPPGQVASPKPGQPTPPGQTGQPGQITSPRPGQPTPSGQLPAPKPTQPGQVTQPKPAQPTNVGTPQPVQQPRPQQPAPQPAPQPKPQVAPQPAPQPKPQAAPQPTPQPRPQVAPQPAPQPRPQAAPQPAPQPRPQVAPQPAPQPRPQPAPQPKPQAAPQPAPQPKPQAAPPPAPPKPAPQPAPAKPQPQPAPAKPGAPGAP